MAAAAPQCLVERQDFLALGRELLSHHGGFRRVLRARQCQRASAHVLDATEGQGDLMAACWALTTQSWAHEHAKPVSPRLMYCCCGVSAAIPGRCWCKKPSAWTQTPFRELLQRCRWLLSSSSTADPIQRSCSALRKLAATLFLEKSHNILKNKFACYILYFYFDMSLCQTSY